MASGGAAALTAEERFSQTRGAYTARDIAVLEGIQAIRHRPSMYIGSTSTSGLVHLLWEALDNAVDEAVAGHGGQIWVDVDREGVVSVLDEGRGMPFDPMTYRSKQLPAATVLLTVPHSGGKFAEGAYKTAGGLHGCGARSRPRSSRKRSTRRKGWPISCAPPPRPAPSRSLPSRSPSTNCASKCRWKLRCFPIAATNSIFTRSPTRCARLKVAYMSAA